ncbi:Rho GTPase activating protein 39 [Balamuthia mandrillaris]
MSASSPQSADPQSAYLRLVQKLLRQNPTCADCGDPSPGWASTTIGVFVCTECSAVHHSLGSTLRSVTSAIPQEEFGNLCSKGNTKVNGMLNKVAASSSASRPTPQSTFTERRQWIAAKYQAKALMDPTFGLAFDLTPNPSLKKGGMVFYLHKQGEKSSFKRVYCALYGQKLQLYSHPAEEKTIIRFTIGADTLTSGPEQSRQRTNRPSPSSSSSFSIRFFFAVRNEQEEHRFATEEKEEAECWIAIITSSISDAINNNNEKNNNKTKSIKGGSHRPKTKQCTSNSVWESSEIRTRTTSFPVIDSIDFANINNGRAAVMGGGTGGWQGGTRTPRLIGSTRSGGNSLRRIGSQRTSMRKNVQDVDFQGEDDSRTTTEGETSSDEKAVSSSAASSPSSSLVISSKGATKTERLKTKEHDDEEEKDDIKLAGYLNVKTSYEGEWRERFLLLTDEAFYCYRSEQDAYKDRGEEEEEDEEDEGKKEESDITVESHKEKQVTTKEEKQKAEESNDNKTSLCIASFLRREFKPLAYSQIPSCILLSSVLPAAEEDEEEQEESTNRPLLYLQTPDEPCLLLWLSALKGEPIDTSSASKPAFSSSTTISASSSPATESVLLSPRTKQFLCAKERSNSELAAKKESGEPNEETSVAAASSSSSEKERSGREEEENENRGGRASRSSTINPYRKEGYLFKLPGKAHKITTGWKKRYFKMSERVVVTQNPLKADSYFRTNDQQHGNQHSNSGSGNQRGHPRTQAWLEYYSHKGELVPKGRLKLNDCFTVEAVPSKGSNCFCINTPSRTLHIRAETEQEMMEWMTAIRGARAVLVGLAPPPLLTTQSQQPQSPQLPQLKASLRRNPFQDSLSSPSTPKLTKKENNFDFQRSQSVGGDELPTELSEVQVTGRWRTNTLSPMVQKDILRFQLEGYAHQYFNKPKRLFRRSIPAEEVLRFSKDPISTSLLKHSKTKITKESLACFQLIQRYMGDHSSSSQYVHLQQSIREQTARELMAKAVNTPQLRDEIYLQICKQTTNNPRLESCVLGWELLTVAVSTFPPTKDLEEYLTKYVATHSRPEKIRSPPNGSSSSSSSSSNLHTCTSSPSSPSVSRMSIEPSSSEEDMHSPNNTPVSVFQNEQQETTKRRSIFRKRNGPREGFKNYKSTSDAASSSSSSLPSATPRPGCCSKEDEEIALNIAIMAEFCWKKLVTYSKRYAVPRVLVPSLSDIDMARSAPFRKSIFGCSLAEVMEFQSSIDPTAPLPLILTKCLDSVLQKDGLGTEGVFRVNGDSIAIAKLSARADAGKYNFEDASVHDVACLLKAWLHELTPPLIGPQYYEDCLKMSDDPEQIVLFLEGLSQSIEGKVMATLCAFLRRFAHPQHLPHTKMTLNNIAVVFAPLFLRCPHDNIRQIMENTPLETRFLLNALQHFPSSPSSGEGGAEATNAS